MRGKGRSCMLLQNLLGITPAYAGKRTKKFASVTMTWDHPRLCGEKELKNPYLNAILGSPPPMRGKGQFPRVCFSQIGITPAYAGKSMRTTSRQPRRWDHPRLCGEKTATHRAWTKQRGSPPPMRGKESRFSSAIVFFRITPAYAGKSHTQVKSTAAKWDHPRLCGEKFQHTLQPLYPQGSPPPMRGKVFWAIFRNVF